MAVCVRHEVEVLSQPGQLPGVLEEQQKAAALPDLMPGWLATLTRNSHALTTSPSAPTPSWQERPPMRVAGRSVRWRCGW
jgi:hypothetical protein